MKEVWKDIKYYEGNYEVSNFGRIRNKASKKLKPIYTKPNGYLFVNLWLHNKQKSEYVHRLVALTFIDNQTKLPQVNHKDEDKTNNFVGNLEWCDCQYNNTYGTARQRGVETFIKNGHDKNASYRMKHNNPSTMTPKKGGDNSNARRVSCDGVEFDCVKSCAEYYGVKYGTMRYWLSGDGNIPKYFKEHNLHYISD